MGAKHNLKHQGPNRPPPDPELYPNYISNRQGIWLHWRSWYPAPNITPRGVVVLQHGLAEHACRYEGTALWLNSNGFIVFLMEHQGHGNSEGDRAHVEFFDDYVDDQELFVRNVVKVQPGVDNMPMVLLGHSMGGLIAASLAFRTKEIWTCVVLSGPALMPDPATATPFLKKMANTLSNATPKLGLSKLDTKLIATNKQVVEFYEQDPAIPRGPLKARWASEMMKGMDAAMSKAPTFTSPLLIVHGEDDKICTQEGSKQFLAKAGSVDKKAIFYPGLKHEILNEVKEGRDKVKADIMEFIDRVLAGSPCSTVKAGVSSVEPTFVSEKPVDEGASPAGGDAQAQEA